MECIDFKVSDINWFQSYLSNRKIFMTLENVFSDAGLINCGVPQGSISGPHLFLIYMSDLPQALNEMGHTSMLTILISSIKIRMLEK